MTDGFLDIWTTRPPREKRSGMHINDVRNSYRDPAHERMRAVGFVGERQLGVAGVWEAHAVIKSAGYR